MNTDTLDRNLMARYYECLKSHPHSKLRVLATQQFDLHGIINGRKVHVMVERGKELTVQWIDITPSIRWLFDAYGT